MIYGGTTIVRVSDRMRAFLSWRLNWRAVGYAARAPIVWAVFLAGYVLLAIAEAADRTGQVAGYIMLLLVLGEVVGIGKYQEYTTIERGSGPHSAR